MNVVAEIENQAKLQSIGQSVDGEPLAELAQQATPEDKRSLRLIGDLATASTFTECTRYYNEFEYHSETKLNNQAKFLALLHAAMLQGLDDKNYRVVRRLFLCMTSVDNDRKDLVGALIKSKNSAELETAFGWWERQHNSGTQLDLLRRFEALLLSAQYKNISEDGLKTAIKYYLQNK